MDWTGFVSRLLVLSEELAIEKIEHRMKSDDSVSSLYGPKISQRLVIMSASLTFSAFSSDLMWMQPPVALIQMTLSMMSSSLAYSRG